MVLQEVVLEMMPELVAIVKAVHDVQWGQMELYSVVSSVSEEWFDRSFAVMVAAEGRAVVLVLE